MRLNLRLKNEAWSELIIIKRTGQNAPASPNLQVLKRVMRNKMDISFRMASPSDYAILEELRLEAFSPIFASFRKILGDEIYELAQKREDEEQKELLSSMHSGESKWDLYVAEVKNKIVGFVSVKVNMETKVGEIGLNAVIPSYSGQGIGTKMYDFANKRMKAAGMRVATVATGGDESHAPARRAYEKSGFNINIPSVWYCRKL